MVSDLGSHKWVYQWDWRGLLIQHLSAGTAQGKGLGACPPLLGNLVHTFDFLRTYPFQRTKMWLLKISNARRSMPPDPPAYDCLNVRIHFRVLHSPWSGTYIEWVWLELSTIPWMPNGSCLLFFLTLRLWTNVLAEALLPLEGGGGTPIIIFPL